MYSKPGKVSFLTYQRSFNDVCGNGAKIELLCEAVGQALFHEACVYHPSSRSIFVTSNQLERSSQRPSIDTSNKEVKLSRIYDDGKHTGRVEEVYFPGIQEAMLNGGVNASASGKPDTILFCAQGSKSESALSGIISLEIGNTANTYEVERVVSSFHGLPFNSVNDVIVDPTDNSIWFTDPCYGYHQGIRPAPQLPNQVYRYNPVSKSIRAVADGFTRPNGLCFSPDLGTLYVTDTGAIHGSSNVPVDPAGPSHIYAFDVVNRSKGVYLTNKRLFAYAPGKFPDGIKCDLQGNVYAGCGDGIEVWNNRGDLLGVIAIPGGVANFCFGEKGTIYACNETKFWKITLNQEVVKGALLSI